MFFLIFYTFSLLLSYKDITRFRVPNVILGIMFVSLLVFGIIEERISFVSFVVPTLILIFFIVLLLLNPKMILGGGDIKYMMIVAFYLHWSLFPIFLIISGVLQTLILLYIQKVKKRRVAPMVPMMFLAVILTQFIDFLNINPIKG
jgi:leader peptidase (prepilin peptidase) / N-methyltransferase